MSEGNRLEELLEEIVDELQKISRHLSIVDNYFYEKGRVEFDLYG